MSAATPVSGGESAGIDPRGPRFGAAITAGLLLVVVLLVTATGLVLHLIGVPGALVVAAAAAFVAAFLNAAVAYCLGCQLYVLLVRLGILRGGAQRA